MGARSDRLTRLRAQAEQALAPGALALVLVGAWTSPSWGQNPQPTQGPASATADPAAALGTAGPAKPLEPEGDANDTPLNGVIELPRGWVPQRSLQPQIPWWQVGLNLSNQLIAPLSGGGKAAFNSASALDLTTSLGSGLNRRRPRGELDRWSLNLHLTNFSATGNFGAEAGLVANQFYPQSLFQSPSGLWLQGLWLQRNGRPHERLAQLKVGNLSLGNSFLHGDAINLYVNSLINGHNGISLPGVPYGPLNSLGAMATVRLGRLERQTAPSTRTSLFSGSLRFGIFQLDSGRNNSSFRGFNQTISPNDGLLELIEWQWPLARRLSHCDDGKQTPAAAIDNQPRANNQEGASPTGAKGQANVSRQAARFVAPSGCQSSRLLQNQLPEPMVQVTIYNANWGFAGVNGPSIQGLAPAGQAPAGKRASGIAAYLALPTPLPLAFASRLWISGSLSGPAAVNPYPAYLAGGWIGQGLLPNRREDLLIVGLAGSSTSATLQPNQPGQAVLELSYQLQLTTKLSLQPYSQLQSGPPGQGPLWTLGLQWSWSL